jgi:hypothetical protein
MSVRDRANDDCVTHGKTAHFPEYFRRLSFAAVSLDGVFTSADRSGVGINLRPPRSSLRVARAAP